MTQDNEHFEFDEQESNDLNKSKKFSAPWNKKFGEDENFKKRQYLSLIHISEPTRPCGTSRMPSSA